MRSTLTIACEADSSSATTSFSLLSRMLRRSLALPAPAPRRQIAFRCVHPVTPPLHCIFDYRRASRCKLNRSRCHNRSSPAQEGNGMIDTVLNLLFRCSHRRLSRPVIARQQKGGCAGSRRTRCAWTAASTSPYDTDRMRLGKRLEDDEVVPRPKPEAAKPAMPKLKLRCGRPCRWRCCWVRS